jgi:hypothetical protein
MDTQDLRDALTSAFRSGSPEFFVLCSTHWEAIATAFPAWWADRTALDRDGTPSEVFVIESVTN